MDGQKEWEGGEEDGVSICQDSWVIDSGMITEGGLNGSRDGWRGVIDLRGTERWTITNRDWYDLEWAEVL